MRDRGGLAAIAISHPHYYTMMVEWSHAFGAPVRLHAADRAWVMRPDAAIEFWDGEQHELMAGVTLLRLGGHFAGGTVLHWAGGDGGRGALLSGDIVQVVADRRWVSFMRSTRTSSPCRRRPSMRWWPRSSRRRLTACTAPGLRGWWPPTPMGRSAARPSATAGR